MVNIKKGNKINNIIESKDNYIIGVFNIDSPNINKDVRIINTFEDFKKNGGWPEGKPNEKEIKENIEIYVNNEKINFSYYYKFKKEGKYQIKYNFKKNLTNLGYLFCGCSSLTNINISNFNTKNVNNMNNMFSDCKYLTNINLLNFNTKNVINMSYIFKGCEYLTNVDLSNFNTQNVNKMSYMFSGCKTLTNINLSNFNTQNVSNMSYMFDGCSSLTNINLSNFNT